MLLVFPALLASADLVFAGYLRSLLQLDLLAGFPDLTGQLLFIGLIAWLLAGGLVYALRHRPGDAAETRLETSLANLSRPFALGFVGQ